MIINVSVNSVWKCTRTMPLLRMCRPLETAQNMHSHSLPHAMPSHTAHAISSVVYFIAIVGQRQIKVNANKKNTNNASQLCAHTHTWDMPQKRRLYAFYVWRSLTRWCILFVIFSVEYRHCFNIQSLLKSLVICFYVFH